MPKSRKVTASLSQSILLPAILFISLVAGFSCRIPREFPEHKPFVFKTNIKVKGKMSNEQRQDLVLRLESQLDDSLQARTVNDFSPLYDFPRSIVYKRLSKPPVFDSANLKRSLSYMQALLFANGYYSPNISDTVLYRTFRKGKVFTRKKYRGHSKEEQRVSIRFTVTPGRQLLFDSVGYGLASPELQTIAASVKGQSLVKKGTPYSRQALTAEISRLVDTFRSRGYYRYRKEDLYAEHDTVFAPLIDPSLDPLEQAELLEKLRVKKENPTVNIVFMQRRIDDSARLLKYFIGNVNVYLDLPVLEDTAAVQTDTASVNNITFITRSKKFNLNFLSNNIYLKPGALYRQESYYRTVNRLSQFPAWQYNNLEFQQSAIADSVLDVNLRMYPARKQKLSAELEASRNTNDIVTTSNLFGTGVNLGLLNRNVFRQSIQSNTNFRAGVELGANFIQTTLLSLSHTISIPKAPLWIQKPGRNGNAQTLINLNASYTDRRRFFTLSSLNGSFGYQKTWTKQHFDKGQTVTSTKTFLWKPLNVEYSLLEAQDSLRTVLTQNPSLKLAFRPGLIIGEQFQYNSSRTKGKGTNSFYAGLEESGAVLGFIRALDEGQLFRFVKGELEFRRNINYGKTQLAFRTYGGVGIAYGRTAGDGLEESLPFYKAFFGGGPNSMRAWQVRQLGLGSSHYYNVTPYNNLDLRFGDIKLEGNVEYRFLLGTLFGIKFRSALFTDIGNIWSRKPIDSTEAAKGSDFQLNRFYKEFAIGAGTGIRVDFNYFLVRLDWAYKVRDPQRIDNPDAWFYKLHLGSGQLQLGINYPF